MNPAIIRGDDVKNNLSHFLKQFSNLNLWWKFAALHNPIKKSNNMLVWMGVERCIFRGIQHKWCRDPLLLCTRLPDQSLISDALKSIHFPPYRRGKQKMNKRKWWNFDANSLLLFIWQREQPSLPSVPSGYTVCEKSQYFKRAETY